MATKKAILLESITDQIENFAGSNSANTLSRIKRSKSEIEYTVSYMKGITDNPLTGETIISADTEEKLNSLVSALNSKENGLFSVSWSKQNQGIIQFKIFG